MDQGVVVKIRAGFARAEEKLKVARKLLASEDFADSVSRAYYAAFYAAEALLMLEGDEPRTHHGVKTLFSLRFVKKGLIPMEYAKIFNGLMKGRESSDYDLFSPIEKQDAEKALGEAVQFVEQARRYVEAQGITLES